MIEKEAAKVYLDIVIISRLGEGDGGRETWLYNFLTEVSRQRPDIAFRIFSLPLSNANIIDNTDVRKNLDIEHIEIPCVKTRIPLSISFAFKFPRIYRKYSQNCERNSFSVSGVGGLEEALSVYLGTLGSHSKIMRIMWLRTIYLREKFYSIPRYLRCFVKKAEERLLKKSFDTIISNGDDTAAYYITRGVSSKVIHNGVRLESYYKAVRAPEGKLAIAFVGRLTDVKGINEFLETVILASRSGLLGKVEFHVVGEGAELQKVQSLHDKGFLQYHGVLRNSDVPKFFSNIDCCVALTLSSESLGGGGVSNALIEQMAARKIIVAWDNTIFRSALYEQECYFVSQGDSNALHECLSDIVDNSDKAQCKALAASKGARRYDIKVHVEKFFEVLDA